MPYHPTPSDSPFNLTTENARWLYLGDGTQLPIVARSRRRIIVECYGERVRLCRRRLERDGFAAAGSRVFFVTSYSLPDSAA